MNKLTLEQELLAVRGPRQQNDLFIQKTKSAVDAVVDKGTFERAIRTTNVTKKENIFMRLRRMSTLGLVALIIGLAIAFTGGAYAAFQAWQGPKATIMQKNNGQGQTLLNLTNCEQVAQGKTGASVRATVNPRSNLSAEDAAHAIQAFCEQAAMTGWTTKNLKFPAGNLLTAYTVSAIEASSLRAQNGRDNRIIRFDKDTLFLSNGSEISKDGIRVGDNLAIVVKEQGNDSSAVAAVVKLSQEAKYYNAKVQMNVHVVRSCSGNPTEDCVDAPRQSIYAANTLDLLGLKDIQGRIVERTNDSLTIKGSSGRLFTISLVDEVLHRFNLQATEHSITIGDMLLVQYKELSSGAQSNISIEEIGSMSLLLDGDVKNSTTKY